MAYIKIPVGGKAVVRITGKPFEPKEGDKYQSWGYPIVHVSLEGGSEIVPGKEGSKLYFSAFEVHHKVLQANGLGKDDTFAIKKVTDKVTILEDVNGNLLQLNPQKQEQQSSTPTQDYVEKKVVVTEKPRDFAMIYALAMRNVMDAIEMARQTAIDTDYEFPIEVISQKENSMFIALNATWSGKYMVSQSEIERMWNGEEPESTPEDPDAKLVNCPECKNNVVEAAYNSKLGMCVVCAKKELEEPHEEIHPQSTANDELPF